LIRFENFSKRSRAAVTIVSSIKTRESSTVGQPENSTL